MTLFLAICVERGGYSDPLINLPNKCLAAVIPIRVELLPGESCPRNVKRLVSLAAVIPIRVEL
jgi:hypothetical protein